MKLLASIMAVFKGMDDSRFIVLVGKSGRGHSYGWKDRHLFFEKMNHKI